MVSFRKRRHSASRTVPPWGDYGQSKAYREPSTDRLPHTSLCPDGWATRTRRSLPIPAGMEPALLARKYNWLASRGRSSRACSLSQGCIDPVLPAWAGLLEELQHILVEAQGDRLLHARNGRSLRRPFDRLRCRLPEGRLRSLQWIVRTAPTWCNRPTTTCERFSLPESGIGACFALRTRKKGGQFLAVVFPPLKMPRFKHCERTILDMRIRQCRDEVLTLPLVLIIHLVQNGLEGLHERMILDNCRFCSLANHSLLPRNPAL